MISIGSIIIQPFIEHNLLETIYANLTIFIVAICHYGEAVDTIGFFEKLLSGKSVVILQDGKMLDHKLKKTRLTRDQFKMRLKQKASLTSAVSKSHPRSQWANWL
ncbi:YetF domain-containing protein [Bacillus sp. SL00103]